MLENIYSDVGNEIGSAEHRNVHINNLYERLYLRGLYIYLK